MLTAVVLICSAEMAADLRNCTRVNATAVMRVPGEFANPVTCFMHGQAFLAETSIGRDLGERSVKVLCARSEAVVGSMPLPGVK